MPPKITPKCAECERIDTMLWRSVDEEQLCNDCFVQKGKANDAQVNSVNANSSKRNERKSKEQTKERERKESMEAMKSSATFEDKRLRKSTRATRFKAKAAAATFASSAVTSNGGNSTTPTSKVNNKGRNRRNLFKRMPLKSVSMQATTHSVESVMYKGSYLQVGDIVSLVDYEENVYYAQIRGLLVDSYSEKSAFLTWLIPTQASPDPKDGFDAATYTIGSDEDLSRRLSCLEFVMHAPSNYYHDRTTPYPLPDAMEADANRGGFIWTHLPSHQRKKTNA